MGLHPLERVYLLGLIPLHIYYTVVHDIIFKGRMEFLPLLLISVYCALGTVYTYIALYIHYLKPPVPEADKAKMS